MQRETNVNANETEFKNCLSLNPLHVPDIFFLNSFLFLLNTCCSSYFLLSCINSLFFSLSVSRHLSLHPFFERSAAYFTPPLDVAQFVSLTLKLLCFEDGEQAEVEMGQRQVELLSHGANSNFKCADPTHHLVDVSQHLHLIHGVLYRRLHTNGTKVVSGAVSLI